MQPPPPVYQIFLKEFKVQSAEVFPEASKKDLSTAGSECWKALTSSAKRVYEDYAAELHLAYKAHCER